MNKEEIIKFANRNCKKSSCFMCKEGDKYETYRQCPFLPLKLIARERKVTEEDVPDTFMIGMHKFDDILESVPEDKEDSVRYSVYCVIGEFENAKDVFTGCTQTMTDIEPMDKMEFDTLSEAQAELYKQKTEVSHEQGAHRTFYRVTEWVIEKEIYDSEDEFVSSEVIEITKML